MPSVYVSIAIGICLASLVFFCVVCGRDRVTLRTWRGLLVYFLLGMGTVWCLEIIQGLIFGL
jgi:hypothetical protein